ncbi:MAG: iron-containing alcohol dehydrogenase [Ignavibacteriae bacterium]|nr:iron-containing alcohol dehydrogenase [Ignavibacteriota bacterium]
MLNFTFHNPTKIVFGRDTIDRAGTETAVFGKRVLLLSGMGSAKRSGVYDRVLVSLRAAGLDCLEIDGVQPNPLLSKVHSTIDAAKAYGADVIVAVGGGSVLDSAKAIAAGAVVEHDVWDFFIRRATVARALPIVAVLTLAATGSEMNGGSVITHDETREKFNMGSPHTYPKVSILDPSVTFSVDAANSAYGAVDAAVHMLEPYFNGANPDAPLQDGLVESLLRTIRGVIPTILEKPDDYQARAVMMWCATYALNGMTSAGMGGAAFPVHMIGHALSALYDTPHAASLAIVLPGWLRVVRDEKAKKIAQLGRAVFGVTETDDTAAVDATITSIVAWLRSINTPASLAEGGILAQDIPRIAANARRLAALWSMEKYDEDYIARILSQCI